MIPKIIHYTWFSGDPLPPEIQECIGSWYKILPDYKFVLWDMDRIKNIDVPFLREALAEKKWAFASDYIRLYAVYNYGGIYLDSDVMVYESFNDLLSLPFFIGREHSIHFGAHSTVCYLTSHCFGGEKGHPFLKDTIEYYENIHFVKCKSHNVPNIIRLDMTIEPYIQSVIAQKYGYDWNFSKNYKQILSNGITVFPSECFDATSKSFNGKKYCKHFALGSWRETVAYNPVINWKYKVKWRIEKLLKNVLNRIGYTIVEIS